MAEPSAADDLKSFDVPDPPRPAGWKLRCLLSALVAFALAAGLLRALRLPHLMWVVEHHEGYRYDGIGYLKERVADWVEEEYDAATIRPYALAIEDPALRGRFHKALAGSGDPAQLDAMQAYVDAYASSYRLDSLLPEVTASMFALDKAQTPARLVSTYATTKESEYAAKLASALVEKIPPADLAPHVVAKVEDPVRRGRFHAALATTKDVAHVDAILAYAETVNLSGLSERDASIKSLAAFGPAATPRLEKVLAQTDSRALVSIAAEVLRTSDLPFLVKRTRDLLDEYDEGVPDLMRYEPLLNAVEQGETPEGASEELIGKARAAFARAENQAYLVFEFLKVLEVVKGDQKVDFCIVRGLSTFNQQIAEWCARQIKARFTPDQLVDTLFSYIAQRTQFKVSEVDVYEGLMKDLGAPGAARVATNLDRLLREASGDPDEVFWLYKKMGFTLLGELGDASAIPVLKKYAADPGSYVLTSTTTDGSGRRTREQTEKKFADVVRASIQAIEQRAASPEAGGE